MGLSDFCLLKGGKDRVGEIPSGEYPRILNFGFWTDCGFTSKCDHISQNFRLDFLSSAIKTLRINIETSLPGIARKLLSL